MKKLLLLVAFASISLVLNAQDVKKEQTKMDVFSSKYGVITRFSDAKLPNMQTKYSVATTRIRKIQNGSESSFFYQIETESKYGTKIASIEYSDLLEVIKALEVLKKTAITDLADNPEYMEAKFTTSDGFQLGYYISKGEVNWYMRLEKYGSGNTIFFNGYDIISSSLSAAKVKMDELKSGK